MSSFLMFMIKLALANIALCLIVTLLAIKFKIILKGRKEEKQPQIKADEPHFKRGIFMEEEKLGKTYFRQGVYFYTELSDFQGRYTFRRFAQDVADSSDIELKLRPKVGKDRKHLLSGVTT